MGNGEQPIINTIGSEDLKIYAYDNSLLHSFGRVEHTDPAYVMYSFLLVSSVHNCISDTLRIQLSLYGQIQITQASSSVKTGLDRTQAITSKNLH